MLGLSLLLVLILVLSVRFPRLNAGLVALMCAVFLGPYVLKTSSSDSSSQLFPTHLFLTLFGITFFFTSLNSTQLLDQLLQRILQRFSKMPRAIPAVLFAAVAVLTACGLGNIAAVALIAPLALPLADKIRFPKTLMSILIVGAANAASFSPLTLPGIFVNSFIRKSIVLSDKISPESIQWVIFVSVFFCITFVTVVGFLLLGGLKWWNHNTQTTHASLSLELGSLSNSRESLTPAQLKSATIASVLAIIFAVAALCNSPLLSWAVPQNWRWIPGRLSDVGTLGWIGSFLLISFKLAELEAVIKKTPWSTLLLVCGMSMYIELLSRAGLASALSDPLQKHIPLPMLTSVFSFFAALVSSFASSVGVALPLFMPLVEAVSPVLTDSLVTALIVSISVGSHLVDASPLSTLGALCLAQIVEPHERNTVYRQLLTWGFVMIPVAIFCSFVAYVIFGR